MVLVIYLHVKFRAFGITFGAFDKSFAFPVSVDIAPFASRLVDQLKVNERGVVLRAELGPVTP